MHRARRFFLLGAAAFVGLGAWLAFTGVYREATGWLLVAGLVYAVALLVFDRRSRR